MCKTRLTTPDVVQELITSAKEGSIIIIGKNETADHNHIELDKIRGFMERDLTMYGVPVIDDTKENIEKVGFPTIMDDLSLQSFLSGMLEFVLNNQDRTFYLTRLGEAGMYPESEERIKNIFWQTIISARTETAELQYLPSNLIIPKSWHVGERDIHRLAEKVDSLLPIGKYETEIVITLKNKRFVQANRTSPIAPGQLGNDEALQFELEKLEKYLAKDKFCRYKYELVSKGNWHSIRIEVLF
jgi:hypothetical protein